ncbi:hypothetical protein PENSTE_c004G00899 [Penicillium steckii]|uniref:C2H2 type master regulator of conidiophore development brlA n=1 Tax=Penicillium steckii TaxID=303698 RepID=A0A1V6TM10_9EURO|nr:hypothetical protein PENSTE_c004G00899 [Penicillium steckii]
MSEFNLPFTTPMPPQIDSPYYMSTPMFQMEHNSPMDNSRRSYFTSPPSPASSTGSQRVSKAKKGKRVHSCEFPGCNKVFTRAEHRRRHELSHKNKKHYQCMYEGCTKAFHRSDYLSQHMARHDQNASVVRKSSVHSNPTSSPFEIPPQSPGVESTIDSTLESTQSQSITSSETPLANCTNCFDCQHYDGSYTGSPSLYSHPISHSTPISNTPLFPTQDPGKTLLRKYPLAFLSSPELFPSQPNQTASSSYWTANVNQQFSSNPMGFDTMSSAGYSPWTPDAESLPTPVQSTSNLPETSPSSKHSYY